jgi:hypothetical protein
MYAKENQLQGPIMGAIGKKSSIRLPEYGLPRAQDGREGKKYSITYDSKTVRNS